MQFSHTFHDDNTRQQYNHVRDQHNIRTKAGSCWSLAYGKLTHGGGRLPVLLWVSLGRLVGPQSRSWGCHFIRKFRYIIPINIVMRHRFDHCSSSPFSPVKAAGGGFICTIDGARTKNKWMNKLDTSTLHAVGLEGLRPFSHERCSYLPLGEAYLHY